MSLEPISQHRPLECGSQCRRRTLRRFLTPRFEESNGGLLSNRHSIDSKAAKAASIAKAETKILEFTGRGYEIVKDHSGYKALSVHSSRGYITVGVGALSHVDYDHPKENGRPGVTVRGIIDAIENPIGCTETIVNDYGEPSYKAVGCSVTAVINPNTGELVTAWETKADDLRAVEKTRGKARRRGR